MKGKLFTKVLDYQPHTRREYCKECKGYVKFKWGISDKKWCRNCNSLLKDLE